MGDSQISRPLTEEEKTELKTTRELRDPAKREAFLEELTGQYFDDLEKKGVLNQLSDEDLERIEYYIRKWVEAQAARDKSSNPKEDEAARKKLTDAIKGIQKNAGVRPCGADDCVKIIPADANPRRRYCSDDCKKRAQNKRQYEKDPDRQIKASKKYLNSIDI